MQVGISETPHVFVPSLTKTDRQKKLETVPANKAHTTPLSAA